MESKDIFFKSGSPARIHKLYVHNEFSTPSPYEKHFWDINRNTYQVDDAASLLLRYLKLLPEPIVPYEYYKYFTAIHEELISATDTNEGYDWVQLEANTKLRLLETVYLALWKLPRINRYLLLYLVDLLRACVGHSNHNLMTSDRLVAVFQPSLLSLQPDEMSIEEHQIAHQVMVFLIEIFDEGQLRDILSIPRAENTWPDPAYKSYLSEFFWGYPRALSKLNDLSRDSKVEERTTAFVESQCETKEDDTNLPNSGVVPCISRKLAEAPQG